MGPDRIREDALRILAPFRLRRRGVETKLVLGNPTKSVDRTLLRNIRNALSWLDRIKAGKTYEQIACAFYLFIRVMEITDILSQNVPLEDVQYLAGHSNPSGHTDL